MPKLVVVKYGGSVLEDGPSIRRAAETIKETLDRGTKVVVVVSAIRGVTDQLLEAAEAISPNTPRDVIDRIIGLGEEQSVRLMASALRYLGVEALEVTPEAPSWPIVTDETYGDAEPIIEECESGAELGLRPLIGRGKTPVVCGFIGRSLEGNVTTLGRGGSDTTAVILAGCLGADELVLVKDVGGVYSADPHRVREAEPIPEMSAWEASLLASTGARVLHDKVFKYKPEGLRIRIVSRDESLNGGGTVIGGTIPEIEIKVHENPVFILNIVGGAAESPETFAEVLGAVGGGGGRSLAFKGVDRSTVLVVDGPAPEVLASVHRLLEAGGGLKAVSTAEGLAFISLRGRLLSDVPSALHSIKGSLGERGMRVHGIFTGNLYLGILVDWDEASEARKVVEEALMGFRDG